MHIDTCIDGYVMCREFSAVEVDAYCQLNAIEPAIGPDEVILIATVCFCLSFLCICSVLCLTVFQILAVFIRQCFDDVDWLTKCLEGTCGRSNPKGSLLDPA